MRVHNSEFIKQIFPIGTRITLIYMDDPYPLPPGTEGFVDKVDDIGQLHVAWDQGSNLALDVAYDAFESRTFSPSFVEFFEDTINWTYGTIPCDECGGRRYDYTGYYITDSTGLYTEKKCRQCGKITHDGDDDFLNTYTVDRHGNIIKKEQ